MLISLIIGLVLQPGITNEAPDIVAAMTQETIEIREDFSGAELVIFGATRGLSLTDEIVVVLRGPAHDLRVMRKVRNFGIWMNSNPTTFIDVPSFYAIASSRPIEEFARPDSLRRQQIGFNHRLQAAFDEDPLENDTEISERHRNINDEYSEAIRRNSANNLLLSESPIGVEILDGGLFRTNIALPPQTPVGDYTAEFYLFRNGHAVASRVSTLRVRKAGMERVIFQFAHNTPILYGLFCVAIAMLFGWLANAIFNRQR